MTGYRVHLVAVLTEIPTAIVIAVCTLITHQVAVWEDLVQLGVIVADALMIAWWARRDQRMRDQTARPDDAAAVTNARGRL